MQDISRINKFIPIMNEISPTFCLAKWHHTTIYLQTGETHSCYHPSPHKIPLKEIALNPNALHNTQQKISERAEMIEGKKPSGCNYCWNIEALGDDYISDRKERNASIYTEERFNNIKANPLKPVNPQYIEISFGNECNFKCGYCHPKHSSSYYKEIKDHGPYTMVKNHRNDIDWFTINEEETNPYVAAWWEWWPEVRKTLTILRITGGEPLLQQSTWKLLEDLEKNPLPNLELNINSNFGVKPILIDRLVEKVNNLVNTGKIKDFKIFTSIDTWGPQAEYIRTGLDLTVWERNLDTYLTKTSLPVTFMITFNILTVTNFQSLLEKILEWRKKYNGYDQNKWQRVRFDTPFLKEPLQYDINILPKEKFMPYMHDHLNFIIDNFFDDSIAYQLSNEFPDFNSDIFNGKYQNQIEYKQTCNIWDRFPKLTYSVFSYLNSREFLNLLSEVTGILNLYPDHGLHGGGWHIHPNGGKLNPHLDYSLHPKLGLQRKYNLLVYLNPNWKSGWGGELGLWSKDSFTDSPGELKEVIEPIFNRAVFFDTTMDSWHGLLNPVNSPDNECRKSIALYYLTDPPVDVDPRGRALFAPTDSQKNDQDILDLIKRRSIVSDKDPNTWSRN